MTNRYKLVQRRGQYPLCILDTKTGQVVGRYYLFSKVTAKKHCDELNGGKRGFYPNTKKAGK